MWGFRTEKIKAKNKCINKLEAEVKRLRNQLDKVKGYNLSSNNGSRGQASTTRTAEEKRR